MKKVFGSRSRIPSKLLEDLNLRKKHFKKRANSINRYGYEKLNIDIEEEEEVESVRRPMTKKEPMRVDQVKCSNRRNLGVNSAESPMRFHKKLNEDSTMYS